MDFTRDELNTVNMGPVFWRSNYAPIAIADVGDLDIRPGALAYVPAGSVWAGGPTGWLTPPKVTPVRDESWRQYI